MWIFTAAPLKRPIVSDQCIARFSKGTRRLRRLG